MKNKENNIKIIQRWKGGGCNGFLKKWSKETKSVNKGVTCTRAAS